MISIKPSFKNFIIFIVILYIAYHALKFTKEMFHNTGVSFRILPDNVWWNPNYKPEPYGIDPLQNEMGDLTLTNLYRQWHNIENVNRIGVLEHSHLKEAGGDDGINRQFYIAEAMDREAQRLQKRIRDEISSRRTPYTDAYADGIPHTELGGNFDDCQIGDCQWDLDNQGQILGIPSTVGTLHAFY